jgi:Concanavalin A-like lectin/glucanases superfamily
MTNKLIRDIKEVIRRLRNRGISFDANRQYPAIPTIDDTTQSHTNALRAIREALETHERRNPKATLDSFVRLYELEDVLGGFKPGESSVPWATQEEVDAGAPRYKAVDPETGAYAYDRFRWTGQHAAGKGTTSVVVSPVAGVATIDCALSNVFELTLTVATTELANPANMLNGQTINIHLRQDATGGRLMTFGTAWTFVNGIDPVMSADPLAVDLLSCQWDATSAKMRCAFLPDFGSGNLETAPPAASDLIFASVGGGNEIFRDRVDLDVAFRTLVGGGDIDVTTDGDTVVVSYTTPVDTSTALASLSDVDLTGIVDDDYLKYAGGTWIPTALPAIPDTTVQTFLTEADETATLPNSRRLVAGAYMDFDTSVAGELAITLSAAPSSTLDALTDVDTTGVVDGNALVYDAGTSTWVPGAGGGGGGGAEPDGDPYWLNVVALLRFDGTDASTTIIDQTGRVWTAFGNAQLDTTDKQFGVSSLLLDGTGDYISTVHDAVLSVGSGDFTIEAWIKRNGVGSTDMISNKRDASSAEEHSFSIGGSGTDKLSAVLFASGSPVVTLVSTTSIINDGLWHHVAFTREGTTCRIFLDGVLEASGTQSGAPSTNTGPLYVGRDGFDTGRDFIGWIDSYRFTRGVARYTTSFGVPTLEFPNSLGSVPEAPNDNILYGRQNGGWTPVSVGGAIPAVISTQAADQSVVSSTTYVASDLSISLEANKTYLVRLNVHCRGLTTNLLNLRTAYTGTASPVAGAILLSNITSNTSQFGARFTSLPNVTGVGTTADFVAFYEVMLTTTTAGTLRLEFAQNASSATAVTIYAGSWMSAELMATDFSEGVSAASVSRNTDLTVTVNTSVDITFTTEEADTENYWTDVTPTRITIPAAGWYSVTGFVMWNSSSGYRSLLLMKNGTTEIAGDVSSTGTIRQNVAHVGYFVAGDYLILRAFCSSTTGTINGALYPARLSIARLSGPRGPQGEQGPLGTLADETLRWQEADLVIDTNAVYQDTDLVIPLVPGTYVVEAETMIRSHITPGALVQLEFSGTAAWAQSKRYGGEHATTWGGQIVTGLPHPTAAQNYTAEGGHRWSGALEVTVAGNLSIQFRQNTSNANPIIFRRGSYLRVKNVSALNGNTIDDEVMADTPLGYWKLDEASGNFADSSGNGYTLPIVGTPVTVYQYENLDPNILDRKGPLVNNSSQANYAGNLSLGLTTPTTMTMEVWGAWHAEGFLMSYGADGETAATNVALQIELAANGVITWFWEYGSGTNGPAPPTYLGGALSSTLVHIAVVKDSAALTCKGYINGRLASNSTYTAGQEHTGGTSGRFSLFNSLASINPGADGVYAGAAIYTTALSQERIKAHVRALGIK